MKCCIVGAGATGGHLAVKLQRAGEDVSVIARGAQLAAIQASGLVLQQEPESLHARVRAAETAAELGAQDLVFVTTKATALPAIAPLLQGLVGEQTTVAFLQNGMTWWYPIGLPAARPRPPALPVFGLAEAFLRLLRPDQVLAGVVYSANEVLQPGVIRNNSPGRNVVELATLDDVPNERVRQAREVLVHAGIGSPVVADIRAALWLKLVVNASSSSMCVALGNPAAIAEDAAVQAVMLRLLQESVAVAAAHGYPVGDSLDFAYWTQRRTRHKPSMLQDFEAGRPMEVAEILLAPVAFARAVGLDTDTLDAVTAIAARLAIDRGLYTPA